MLALFVAAIVLLFCVVFSYQGGKLSTRLNNPDRNVDGTVGWGLGLALGAVALACARYL